MSDKFAIARALREIALLLRVRGEDRFRQRAYHKAAAAVEVSREDLATLVRERRLQELEGVGRALAAVIAEIHDRGTSSLLERLRRGVPKGIADLIDIPHLGIKKILALHEELGIETVADLRAACEREEVRRVPGFGKKTERAIQERIERLDARERGHLLFRVLDIGTRIVEHLRATTGVVEAEIAGSVRRSKEVVNDLDVVVAAADAEPVIERLLAHPLMAEAIDRNAAGCRVRLAGRLHVDLVVTRPRDFAVALLRSTGSAAHIDALDGIAGQRGVALAGASEADIYARLGMMYVPPELRENQGEIEGALAGTLPDDLVCLEDVRGLVHCHTVYSDGKNTIEEMARAADAMAVQYLTITDHSATARYAGGLEADRLRRQWDEIARVQENVRVRLLRGTESDILGDGSFDYPDTILEQLDVVIASIHSRMKMDAAAMTRRLVTAMRQPIFKIWGHALGRLLLKRPPFECDVESVLDAAAESRAAIEINGDPYRLDLEPRWVRAARSRGIRFVISTDAHSTKGFANLRFGVAIARRGWVRRGETLNTLPPEAFCAAVRPAA